MKILLVSMLLLIACPNLRAMEFSRKDDTVILQGLIQVGDYEKFLPLASNASHVLITASPGGNAENALKIAEFIETKKMTVQVSGPCMSACASILLLASSSRQVDEHALLVFHSGTAGLAEKMISDLESLSDSAKKLPFYQSAIHQADYQNTQALLNRLNVFYARQGISLEGIRNMEYVVPDPGGYLGTIMTKTKDYFPLYLSQKNTKCKVWIPGEAELLEIGIKLDTPYSPQNSPLIIKHTDGSLEVKDVGRAYLGSIFDSERIKTECNVTLPKHLSGTAP